MKITVVLLSLLGVALAVVYEMPLIRMKSLTGNSRREGKWKEVNKVKLASKASGDQSITDWDDVEYTAQIQLGTPAQNFSVLIDTSSANLWVADKSCVTCVHMTKYNRDASSTYVANGQRFDGDLVRGILGQDKLCLGSSNLCFNRQVFAMVNYCIICTLPPDGHVRHYDGVLGLGWPAISIDHVVPPVQNLLPNLDQPLFTIWFARVGAQDNVRNGGLITYGATDNTHCSSTINYVPLTAETFWQFRMSGISVGTYSQTRNWQARIVTGTWSIGGPTNDITAIMMAIGGRRDPDYPSYGVVPCNGTYPPVVLTIGGKQYSIPQNQYVLPLPRTTTKCYLAFYDAGDADADWILSEPFVRSYCTIYHVGGKKIGFADSKM